MVASCSAAHAAGALFCVSGSHPFRSLPGASRCAARLGALEHRSHLATHTSPAARRLLTDSFGLLEAARQLRDGGAIPAHVGLWAAENPVLERSAARLQAKVEAGAERVLTQPPLAWERFQVRSERRLCPSRFAPLTHSLHAGVDGRCTQPRGHGRC